MGLDNEQPERRDRFARITPALDRDLGLELELDPNLIESRRWIWASDLAIKPSGLGRNQLALTSRPTKRPAL